VKIACPTSLGYFKHSFCLHQPPSIHTSFRHGGQIQWKEGSLLPKGFLFTIKKTIEAWAHIAYLDLNGYFLLKTSRPASSTYKSCSEYNP
jgi:hypothetical protein